MENKEFLSVHRFNFFFLFFLLPLFVKKLLFYFCIYFVAVFFLSFFVYGIFSVFLGYKRSEFLPKNVCRERPIYFNLFHIVKTPLSWKPSSLVLKKHSTRICHFNTFSLRFLNILTFDIHRRVFVNELPFYMSLFYNKKINQKKFV